jgi:hypothetical protein
MAGMFSRFRDALFPHDRTERSTHVVRGFTVEVENSREDIRTADVVARLDEALGLIEMYQPWRLRHLRRDLERFWTRAPA